MSYQSQDKSTDDVLLVDRLTDQVNKVFLITHILDIFQINAIAIALRQRFIEWFTMLQQFIEYLTVEVIGDNLFYRIKIILSQEELNMVV